jgi:hypothetical protein
MKIRYVRTTVYACVLLTPALAFAAEAPLKPPTWPQDFSVAPGERATFGIPNPGTGSIKVSVTWTGGSLNIAATGSDGKVVVPPADRSGPSHSFAIDTQTLGDPAKCPLVVVTLQLPKAVATNPKATANATAVANATVTGKIAVQSAPVDMARFQERIKPLLARQVAKPAPPTPQQSAVQTKAAEAAAEAKNKAIEAEKLTQVKSLMTQAKTEIATRRNTLKNMAYPAKSIKTLRPSVIAGAAKGGLPKAGAPQGAGGTGGAAKSPTPPVAPILRGVMPEGGMTGEQVTLVGAGLAQDATEIHFTLAPNVVVQANILSFEAQGDGTVKIKVQVPEKAGLTSPFAGQVVAKAVDRNPVVTTNALSFKFTPVVTPSIVYLDPVEVQPNVLVQLQGNNFAQGDVVHFVIPGVGDYTAPETIVQDTTRMGAKVPPYTAREIGNGSVYITRKVPAGWVSSQNAALIFNPSLPLIQSLPDSAAADSPILLRGVSFGGPSDADAAGTVAGVSGGTGADSEAMAKQMLEKAKANAGASQNAGGAGGGSPSGGTVYLIDEVGKEHLLSVSYWTNTHIVARTPPLTGFVNPKSCKIYVKSNVGKSDPKPLALTPSLTTTLMLITDLMANNDYRFVAKQDGDTFAVFPTPALGVWINGYHHASLFTGFKDNDEYFLNRKLRNGWVVDSIDFASGSARLEESRVGTDSPYVKVHWWCDAPWQNTSYTVKIFVKGPKGTMY